MVLCPITPYLKKDEFKDCTDDSSVKRTHAALPQDQNSILAPLSSSSQFLVTPVLANPIPVVFGGCLHSFVCAHMDTQVKIKVNLQRIMVSGFQVLRQGPMTLGNRLSETREEVGVGTILSINDPQD